MIASEFTYIAPSSEAELAAVIMTATPPIRFMSGGTWFVPLLDAGHIDVNTVIDLSEVGLDHISIVGDAITLGAATTYASLLDDRHIRADAPLLSRMAETITGGPQIRHRGTIGGSAVYANPASDVPTALAALGARLEVRSPSGSREIDALAFYVRPFETQLRSDEYLARIRLPRLRSRVAYRKLKFGESSWPVVTVGVVVPPVGPAHVGLGGVGQCPIVMEIDTAESDIRGAAADWLSRAEFDPWSDHFADAAYRLQVAPAMIDRTVRDALRGPA